jgi:Na+/H+ antiporter NhaD/arsenite permease-like protein
LTIITSACFDNFLSLPPAAGMMLGLTYLKFFSYYLQKTRDSYSVALTAGVGRSMLAVGSAAGVGLMGQAKGIYTFVSHLKRKCFLINQSFQFIYALRLTYSTREGR